MNAQSNNRYPNTKFVFLSDGESVASAKKNYFLWIITVTILFFIAVAYLSYKFFIAPSYFSDQKLQPFNTNNTFVILDQKSNSTLRLYPPGPLLSELKNRKNRNKFTFEESRIRLQTIPDVFIERISHRDFENLQDFISLDLLLYYENIINKFDVKILKLIFNEYQHKLLLLENSEDFVDFLSSLKSNKFKFYISILKEEKFKLDIKDFEDFFALTEELNHWYNYIYHLSGFLSIYEQQKLGKYLQNCTEESFEKFTQETQKQLFHFGYPFKITEKKLQEINGVISIWSEPITKEFYNCSMIFYRKILILSAVNEEIRRLNASCLKNLYVFASHILYLDVDLALFGVNVAIVAPEWLFLKKVKINLNGIIGKELVNETASSNRHGMPGNPGGHAGDFLGIGNLHEKFLNISTNGGKGGKGQNGAKGLDGMHFTRPGPPVDRPTCVSKIITYQNSFGEKITHYNVFSPFGCGHSGTNGGVGGEGGAGGVVTLISDSIKITRGSNGMTGTPGKGGAGGRGGQNGCFYEVLDVDDEILHPMTRVICPRGNILPSGNYGKDNYNSQGQILPPKKEYLTVHNTLNEFLKFAGNDFVENNDPNMISFLKNLHQLDLHNKTYVTDILTEFKLLEMLNRVEFYKIFKEKISKYSELHPDDDAQLLLKYLMSLTVEKIMILKENVNFFSIDFKNYLNIVERSIKTTDEHTRELESVSYFKKKIHVKIEEIKMKLNQIKLKSSMLTSGVSSYAESNEEFISQNNSSYLAENEKVLHMVADTIDVLHALLNPVFGDSKQMKINNLLKSLQGKASHNANSSKNSKSPLKNAGKILLNILECLRNKNSQETRRNLSNLKEALCSLKDSNVFSNEIKSLLETLTDEMEHIEALYPFFDWEELEISFFKSLDSLPLNSNSELGDIEEIKFLKSRLLDGMITLQCKLAMQSARMNLHTFNIPVCLQLLHNKTITKEPKNWSKNLEYEVTESFSKHHFNAVFDKNSAVGEFFFWSNIEIRDKLKKLFSGAEINLKSNLINYHVFDKNFIQFRSLKVEFETGDAFQKQLQEILSFFRIQMIHSGYSYYNWEEETQVFVSETVNLEYSFRVQDKNYPEVYNTMYKKCQDGEIKLSPYTTWSLRLLPINDKTDFDKLMPFADTVNLRLIGTGTYIA